MKRIKKWLILIFLTTISSVIALLISLETITVVNETQEQKKLSATISNSSETQHVDLNTSQTNTLSRGNTNREQLILPIETNGKVKTYMDYRCITDTSSDQYKLQQKSYTDEYGYRRTNEYYMIALGSAYDTEIGTKYLITLDTGLTFPAILGDCKADIHTDPSNKYIPHNGNVIEFIVDTRKLIPEAKSMGDVNYGGFKGGISKIERLIDIEN